MARDEEMANMSPTYLQDERQYKSRPPWFELWEVVRRSEGEARDGARLEVGRFDVLVFYHDV